MGIGGVTIGAHSYRSTPDLGCISQTATLRWLGSYTHPIHSVPRFEPPLSPAPTTPGGHLMRIMKKSCDAKTPTCRLVYRASFSSPTVPRHPEVPAVRGTPPRRHFRDQPLTGHHILFPMFCIFSIVRGYSCNKRLSDHGTQDSRLRLAHGLLVREC